MLEKVTELLRQRQINCSIVYLHIEIIGDCVHTENINCICFDNFSHHLGVITRMQKYGSVLLNMSDYILRISYLSRYSPGGRVTTISTPSGHLTV